MPVIDRMEFPRKYKLKDSLVVLVLLAMFFGIWLNNNSQKNIADNVIVSQVSIDSVTANYIELSYRVENRLYKDMNLRILAKVYDNSGSELASSMYMLEIPARRVLRYTKVFDELTRKPTPGDKNLKADISVYTRKAF